MYIKPFFSIIIPAYQAQSYIINTIQSVLSQDFANYEIIVVDDGSTDNTVRYVKSLHDKRIICFRVQHSGTQSARYYGIQKAKGRYLVFLDADDCLTSKALDLIYQNIQNNPCDLYIGGMLFFDIDGVCHEMNKEVPVGYLEKSELFIMMTQKRMIKTLARKVVRKKLALYTGEMIQNYSMSYGEDMFYSMDLLLEINSIYVSHDVIYEYILRKDGTMNSFNQNKYIDRIQMCKAINYYGRLLDMDYVIIQKIAETYLVKQLADCLLEIEYQSKKSSYEKKTYVNEKRKILEELNIHFDSVVKYSDSFSDNQINILHKYGVY